ncbi:retrovirus-related pol polyprotein from transposon TNT 1-94 [Tanacetum coccineum]
MLSWNMILKNVTRLFLEKLDWENPEGGDYPFDLTKPLPLVMSRNRQKVPVDYFFNNDLKYLQGGISTMTYVNSLTKINVAQYDLPGIEDMVPNIWVPVKVAYDKHALWGISHWRKQRKTFYGYARGLQSIHDVYSMKRILAVTQVEVMRKHEYGYLKEIVVRRADNGLYRFKEGGFPRLRINDIEDMLLLVVQNRLTNLSGDDVFDFAIALRMFTRSLVIQKRVEDLQLGVESHQKKINVTKTETTKFGIRKRDPYTPYQDPQGFIYVDNNGRNRLMRLDELYKFSDRTLIGLRTSLDDITKNIRMEYLPKRRWGTLEKRRANIMIKSIDKQLKERRLMRSLERKWEVSGIPCKHAVACIFNMADNGIQVGLLEDWVHGSMSLQTWRNVYSCKINLIPSRQFWEKSHIPTTLIPPYILPQVGRPCKKRKKSTGEVAEMVKRGKLTRKYKIVTCFSCGQKGHNKRSCTRPNNVAASGAGSGSQTPRQRKASTSQAAIGSQPPRQSQRSTSQAASGSQPPRQS